MSTLKIYGLPEATIKALQEIGLKRLGKASASAAVKILVQEAVTVASFATSVANTANHLQEGRPVSRQESGKYRLVLRLRPDDYYYFHNNGQIFGMTASTFAVSILRHYVDKHPTLSDSELQALYQSNYQLLRIGRNLNQIARQLNAGESASLSTEEIRQLCTIIEKHTDLASDMYRATKERFD